MDRRQFLRASALAAFVAATAGPVSGCAGDAEIDVEALAHPMLLAVLGAESVRALGATYRQGIALGADSTALRNEIVRGTRWRLRHRAEDAAWLDRQVQEDFAAGRVVLVDGWVLSRTEALQCALFSLGGNGPA